MELPFISGPRLKVISPRIALKGNINLAFALIVEPQAVRFPLHLSTYTCLSQKIMFLTCNNGAFAIN